MNGLALAHCLSAQRGAPLAWPGHHAAGLQPGRQSAL